MKTTVDIPENELQDVMRHTRAKTKREAINHAIAEFNRRERMENFLKLAGKMDGIMTQEELRKMREMD